MKKGFTLVELLVTIACASIALLMITTTLILITTLNNKTIKSSSDYYKLSTIREYITNNCTSTNYDDVNVDDGDVIFDSYTIVTDTNVTNIKSDKTSNSDTTIITYTLHIDNNPDYIFYVILKQEE